MVQKSNNYDSQDGIAPTAPVASIVIYTSCPLFLFKVGYWEKAASFIWSRQKAKGIKVKLLENVEGD